MTKPWFKHAWQAFCEWGNSVPDCPSCRGTGEDCGRLGDYVYWKGKLHLVCFQCKGSGKV
jgi:hypothetical protein